MFPKLEGDRVYLASHFRCILNGTNVSTLFKRRLRENESVIERPSKALAPTWQCERCKQRALCPRRVLFRALLLPVAVTSALQPQRCPLALLYICNPAEIIHYYIYVRCVLVCPSLKVNMSIMRFGLAKLCGFRHDDRRSPSRSGGSWRV